MADTLWREPQRRNAQELVDWLLSQIRDGALEWDWVNSVAVFELASSSSDSRLTYTAALSILVDMHREGEHDLAAFERIFDAEQRKLLAELPMTLRSRRRITFAK